VNESSSPPFDPEQFARQTIFAIETGDYDDMVTEDRLTRIEEAIAAPWPRRWLLWRRLRREIRASVAGYPDDYIPRGDFRGRRQQWADEQATVAYMAQRRQHGGPGEPGHFWTAP